MRECSGFFDPPNRPKYLGYLKKNSHWVSAVRGYVHCKLSPICHLFFDRDPWFTWSKESQIRYIISNLGFIIFYNFYKTGSFFMQNTIYSVFFELRHPLLKPFLLSLSCTRCLFGLHVPTVSLWSRVGWHFKVKESRD